jgi:hypothetical protein
MAMRAKAKRISMWAAGIVALLAAGMFMGGSRPAVSAQTEVLVQGRYIFMDKSDESHPRHYLIFDTQDGSLREWTEEPSAEVYTYDFSSPREIKVNSTAVRR